LLDKTALQRIGPLWEVFNGLRWPVRAAASSRLVPRDLPPWFIMYQQTQRWIAAGLFEDIVQELRRLSRLAAMRTAGPRPAIFNSRTVQSTPNSGGRAGDDWVKRHKGSKVHAAVDDLGRLLALGVGPVHGPVRSPGRHLG